MSITLQEGYLFLTFPFLLFWILLFLLKKTTHKQQLYMSLFVMPFGPLSELIYFKDYWKPLSIFSFYIGPIPIYFEDVLFGFAIGGIGAVIYEVFFHKHLARLRKKIHRHVGTSVIGLLFLITMLVLLKLGINSIFATSFALLFATLLIIMQRKDLLAVALWSGICVMLTMFGSYFILYHTVNNVDELLRQSWLLFKTPLGIRFLGIPITEMLWGFSWGMMAGPLYAFSRNLEFDKDRRKIKQR